MKLRVRTLDDLQARVIQLQRRLEKVLANPAIPAATKSVVAKFETQTLTNLKGQLRIRQAWLLRCAGC